MAGGGYFGFCRRSAFRLYLSLGCRLAALRAFYSTMMLTFSHYITGMKIAHFGNLLAKVLTCIFGILTQLATD